MLQLYLNYKLKSVAHLPWRQMTYKFLNTIVDDLGCASLPVRITLGYSVHLCMTAGTQNLCAMHRAFIIKMPALHRLAVFRDDVVFVILLYQRWIYPIDKKRANEFGCA